MFFLHAPDLWRIFVSTTSITARLLTVCILLLSFAPLGSTYILQFSMGIFERLIAEEEQDLLVPQASSLSTQLSDNMTMEQLWSVVFAHRVDHAHHFIPKGSLVLAYYMPSQRALLLDREHLSMHLRIFLPWLVSFTMGVVIPTVFNVWSLFRNRSILAQQRQRRENRWSMTIDTLQGAYSKQLTLDDRVDNATGLDGDIQVTLHHWTIPLPASSVHEKTGTSRTLSSAEECIICLRNYQLGDSVSWSVNRDCVHVFHTQCIAAWLFRKRNQRHCCPCCRRCFVTQPVTPRRRMAASQ